MTQPQLQLLWTRQFPFSFGAVAVGFIFDSNDPKVVVGDEHAKVHIINKKNEIEEVLETKGGGIQALLLHNVTQFGSVDLIAGDSGGALTLFCRHEILARRVVGSAVTALAADVDAGNNCALVAGDSDGVLTAFQAHGDLWRTRLADDSALPLAPPIHATLARVDVAVRCLLSAQLADDFGHLTHYLLLADGRALLHYFCNGTRVHSLPLPALINCIAAGFFLPVGESLPTAASTAAAGSASTAPSSAADFSQRSHRTRQLALAGVDGFIYIVQNHRVTHSIKVGTCVTQLVAYQRTGQPDLLLCAGHFNSLKIFQGAELIIEHKLDDWIHCLCAGDVDGDGEGEVVLGLLNNSLLCYRLPSRISRSFASNRLRQ